MAWEDDWKRWTHTTYGLIQAISLTDKLDGGNLARLEETIRASADWSDSQIGFSSSADRLTVRSGTIDVDLETTDALLRALKTSISSVLLIGTVSVLETLLADLLLTRGVVQVAPSGIAAALSSLKERLTQTNTIEEHQWALEASHEMRVLRNVLVHAAGVWSQRAIDDLFSHLPTKVPPTVGERVSINMNDVFAYRRAARSVLNAAARA